MHTADSAALICSQQQISAALSSPTYISVVKGKFRAKGNCRLTALTAAKETKRKRVCMRVKVSDVEREPKFVPISPAQEFCGRQNCVPEPFPAEAEVESEGTELGLTITSYATFLLKEK